MSDRDELADILMSDAVEMTDATGRNYALVEADAILAARYRKPRTVITVEELDALPVGSVVIDADEYVGRKERNSTRLSDWAVTLHKYSKDAMAFTLPATVLWEPLP